MQPIRSILIKCIRLMSCAGLVYISFSLFILKHSLPSHSLHSSHILIKLINFSIFKAMGGVGHCNCRHHHPYYRYNDELSDYDDYDYTDDDDSDEEFWESIASRLRNKYEARKYMPKGMKSKLLSWTVRNFKLNCRFKEC